MIALIVSSLMMCAIMMYARVERSFTMAKATMMLNTNKHLQTRCYPWYEALIGVVECSESAACAKEGNVSSSL